MTIPAPISGSDNELRIRQLGLQDYRQTWQAMQAFNQSRTPDTLDEIWLLEHPPVFTLGLNGKQEHVLDAGEIPLIQTDRGGQVTYHGPGQLVTYLMIDLRRHGLGVRSLVSLIEQSIIGFLYEHGIAAIARQDAPGVYVDGAKLAALGLRIRRGCSYHGLSLNVNMDLEPFERINPCGYPALPVTQLRDLGIDKDMGLVAKQLLAQISKRLNATLCQPTAEEQGLP